MTHVALCVRDAHASADFYGKYASMQIVHERRDDAGNWVLWISDRTRPFVVVLIEVDEPTHTLGGFQHLGVGCESRAEVDRLADLARSEGRLRYGPLDYGYPVGYWAFIEDPDGHNLEISHGQEVGLTVADAGG